VVDEGFDSSMEVAELNLQECCSFVGCLQVRRGVMGVTRRGGDCLRALSPGFLQTDFRGKTVGNLSARKVKRGDYGRPRENGESLVSESESRSTIDCNYVYIVLCMTSSICLNFCVCMFNSGEAPR